MPESIPVIRVKIAIIFENFVPLYSMYPKKRKLRAVKPKKIIV
ncbi:MAG: hypothetical protein ACFFFB_10380 [Candidatus Heimdallarchaeota archaeon]